MAKQSNISAGQEFGGWTLVRFLGRGGNGEVWQARRENGPGYAIKILSRIQKQAYKRFRDEIECLKLAQGVPGILPLIDSYFPDDFNLGRPWYVMPLAAELLSGTATLSVPLRVRRIWEAAATLASLHEMGIAHRDVKPRNLLIHNGRCHLSDFGLATFPHKSDLTRTREQIGPKLILAPEARRNSKAADPFAVDVYHLAKTMWILLTDLQDGFDGPYTPATQQNLADACGPLYLSPLDALLEECTRDLPTRRPLMADVRDRLGEWLSSFNNFQQYNPRQWKEIQLSLFPSGVPSHAEWQQASEIVKILNAIASVRDLVHMALPGSGTAEFTGAEISRSAPDHIDLITPSSVFTVPVKRLIFESFGDPQWSYVFVDGGIVASESNDFHAVVGEIESSTYPIWSRHNQLLYREEIPLRNILYTKGSFLLVPKTSLFNRTRHMAEGFHSTQTPERFRIWMAELRRSAEEVKKAKSPLNPLI